MWKFRTRSGLSFNCRKEEREGNVLIKCEPIEKKDDIKQQLSERPIILRLTENGKLDLIDDGGVDRKIIEELDEYLEHFIR